MLFRLCTHLKIIYILSYLNYDKLKEKKIDILTFYLLLSEQIRKQNSFKYCAFMSVNSVNTPKINILKIQIICQ